MENFCTICNTMHDSPKWYNMPNGLMCKNAYLKQYYEKNKEDVNKARKRKYQEDVEYRNAVNERNKEADKKRRSEGYYLL